MILIGTSLVVVARRTTTNAIGLYYSNRYKDRYAFQFSAKTRRRVRLSYGHMRVFSFGHCIGYPRPMSTAETDKVGFGRSLLQTAASSYTCMSCLSPAASTVIYVVSSSSSL